MLHCHFFLNYYSIFEGNSLKSFPDFLYIGLDLMAHSLHRRQNSRWDISQLSEPTVREENETRQCCINQMHLILHGYLPIHIYISV